MRGTIACVRLVTFVLLNECCGTHIQCAKYNLFCPLCKDNCCYGLFLHQYDPENDDCCYFSCVKCVSRLRKLSKVPAKHWQRLDASDLNKYTKNSWRPCFDATRKLVELMEAKAKVKSAEKKSNKRKRKVPTTSTPTASTHDNLQVAEMISAHIGNIHSQLRIIERLLATIRS